MQFDFDSCEMLWWFSPVGYRAQQDVTRHVEGIRHPTQNLQARLNLTEIVFHVVPPNHFSTSHNRLNGIYEFWKAPGTREAEFGSGVPSEAIRQLKVVEFLC